MTFIIMGGWQGVPRFLKSSSNPWEEWEWGAYEEARSFDDEEQARVVAIKVGGYLLDKNASISSR